VASLARWCYRHRITVVVAWLVVLLSAAAMERAWGSAYSNTFTLPGTESSRALDLLSAALPKQAGDSDSIVWRVSNGSVTAPAVRTRMESLLKTVAARGRWPSCAVVRRRWRCADQPGRKTAYATVQFTKLAPALPKQDVRNVIDLVRAARTSGLQVEIGGQAIEQANQLSLSYSVAIGIVAAAVIILLAFGSLLGMALPLVAAAVALGTATFAIDLFSHLTSMAVIAPTLAALIGLGVGIDYALFIITRHRDGLKSGLSPEEAAVRALNTAGRAVLFAGGTVCIALLGMLVLRLSFLNGMAYAAAGNRGVDDGNVDDPVAGAARFHRGKSAQPERASAIDRERSRRRLPDQASGRAGHGLSRGGRVFSPWVGGTHHRYARQPHAQLAAGVFLMRATMPPARPRARPTTCLAAAFGPGSNGRCCWCAGRQRQRHCRPRPAGQVLQDGARRGDRGPVSLPAGRQSGDRRSDPHDRSARRANE